MKDVFLELLNLSTVRSIQKSAQTQSIQFDELPQSKNTCIISTQMKKQHCRDPPKAHCAIFQSLSRHKGSHYSDL